MRCWRPRRRPSALWGGGGRGDECRHLAGTGLAYGLRRVSPPGAWPAPRSTRMTSEIGPRSRRSKPTCRPAGLPQGLGSASGLSRHPGRKRVCARTICSRPIAAAAVAAIPMTVRSSLMPRTSCGAPMAFGCSRWTTAGAGSSPPSSIGTPSVSAGMSADRFAALQPISMGLAGLSTAAGSGAGLAGITARVRFWGIQPSPSSPSPRPTASPSGSIARKEIIHGRIYRNIVRPAPSLAQSFLSPAQARRRRRDLNQARRVRQT